MIIPATVIMADVDEAAAFLKAASTTDVYRIPSWELQCHDGKMVMRVFFEVEDMIALVFALGQLQQPENVIVFATRQDANAAFSSHRTEDLYCLAKLIEAVEVHRVE